MTTTKNLESPIAFYKPNCGAASFVDTEDEEVKFVGHYACHGNTVNLTIHTLTPFESIEWVYDDGTDEVSGSKVRHTYPAATSDVTYNVVATVTYMGPDPEDEESTIELEEVVEIDVLVKASATLALDVATDTLSNATRSQTYTATIVGEGGKTPYVWALTQKPTGMSINASTGVITWAVPADQTLGATVITVSLTDNEKSGVTKNLTITVVGA